MSLIMTTSESHRNALQFWQKLRVAMIRSFPPVPHSQSSNLKYSITGRFVINAHRDDQHMKSGHHSRTPPSSLSPQRRKVADEQRGAALELAITALGFVAGAPEELSRFLALTGIAPDAIRAAAAEPGFLGGVLAYIAGNERTLLAFAAQAGIAPEEIEKARTVLAGADWEREVP
jgi:Protein of unknown function (DUF3572)